MAGDLGIGGWPARRARIGPARVALRQGDRSLTYAELAAQVDRLATVLDEAGVARGDRVAWLGANDIATLALFFATTRLGAVFVPLSTRLAPPEIAYLLDDCAPRLLVYAPGHEDAARVADPLALSTVDLFERERKATPLAGRDVGLDDDAVILYTSGTTGRPKGAVLSHGNLTFNTMNQLAHIDVLSTDVALCVSPMFHATGLVQVSLPTLFKGGTVVVVPRFEPGAVLRTIAEQRITAFSAVPTMLQMLADHPDFARTDLGSLRYVNYGGSTVLARVAEAWHRRGVLMLQGYGMTEASPGVLMAVPDGAHERLTSAGVPHFFTDIALAPGPDTGAHTGELLVRGPNVFRGYWKQPESTARALVSGWYHTGDVVTLAEDGWAYVVDRIKDMIITGGENVYPAEVEAVLVTLPGVLDSAVVAVPDERWGEVGMAFLVLAPGASWTAEALDTALRGRLAPFKIPKHVVPVPELPRTPTGKVNRRRLRTGAEQAPDPER